MRRLLTLAMLVAGMWMLPMEASAQFSLGGLWNAITGEDDEPSRYEELADDAPDYDDILGTWYYSHAKVDYFGDSKIAEVAISELNGIAQDLLNSYDVDEGLFKITVKRNGTIVGALDDETLTGEFTYDSSDAEIELYVTIDGTQLSCDGYVEQYNNRLKIYLEVEDLLSAYKSLGVSYDASIVSLAREVASRFGDVYVAINFSRS